MIKKTILKEQSEKKINEEVLTRHITNPGNICSNTNL